MDKDKQEVWLTYNGNEFTFDKKNQLYINGKQVLTKKIIKLKLFERVVVFIVSSATAIQAIFSVLTYFYK